MAGVRPSELCPIASGLSNTAGHWPPDFGQ